MALATYSDLKTSIGNWLARDDLTSYYDDWIDLAEARMNRDLRLNLLEKRATLNTVANDGFVKLPNESGSDTECTEIRKLSYTASPSSEPLSFATPHDILWRRCEGLVGKPRFYNVTGTEIQLAPIPDGVYTLSVVYFAELNALSDSNTTNDILTKHPDLYLFGALAESAPFLRDDERVTLWEGKYAKARAEARRADQRLKYSGPLVQRAG